MSRSQRIALALTLVTALLLGFATRWAPDTRLDPDRLHIFLLNLSFGGAVLQWFVRGRRPTTSVSWWLAISLAYALSAFLEVYPLTLVLSLPLCLMVEQARISRFPVLPTDVLRPGDLSSRFLHTAMLCQSVAIVTCSIVIGNNEFLHSWHQEALDLDMYFLFYSFPISLATFSVVFSLVPAPGPRVARVSYWGITGGVVAFFLAIVTGSRALEMLGGTSLVLMILMIVALFARGAPANQERSFLLSAQGFLVVAGLTGVGFIAAHIWAPLGPMSDWILMLHGTIALYGWSLGGLLVMLRWAHFPIAARAWPIIALHWVTVLVLIPAGKTTPAAALLATPPFVALVVRMLLGRQAPARPTSRTHQPTPPALDRAAPSTTRTIGAPLTPAPARAVAPLPALPPRRFDATGRFTPY